MEEQVKYLPKELIDVIEECRSNNILDIEYLDKFEREAMMEMPLHIGVIGKMKAGKSTFLNALIFKDNVLGMSIVPMTAVLTEISYNEHPETIIEVELFTSDDIDNIKKSIGDFSEEESKRAKEHYDAICKIENIENYLGKKYNIGVEELIEYTSTEGNLSALTKCVRIKYHNEALKGITIIDTPGFNDPVQSRVEATKIAIAKCQVLLFLHSTTNHYDRSEVNMLKEYVELAKTAKLIDVINKVDELPLEEWLESKTNIDRSKEQLINSVELDNHALSLLRDSRTDYICSIMALLGYRLERNRHLTHDEEKMVCSLCQDFDISKDDFVEYSNIVKIISLVNEISGIKDALMRSSLPNELRGELIKARETLTNEIMGLQTEVDILSSDVNRINQAYNNISALITNINEIFAGRDLYSTLERCAHDKKEWFIAGRDSSATNEFTSENYINYNALSNGVKLSNMSRYNDFVHHYICDMRIELKHFNQSLSDTTETYMDSIESQLINANVDRNIINMFMPKIKGLISPMIRKTHVGIEHYGLENKKKGNPQKDIYRNDFYSHFSDTYISDVFERFNNVIEQFDFTKQSNFKQGVFDLTMELKNKLARTVQNPSLKKEEIENSRKKISVNERKISKITSCIERIESLIQ